MTIVDRSGPGVRITLLDNERAPSGEPLDLAGRIIAFTYEDAEKKADQVSLQLDNFDLALFERAELVGGATLEVSWGYPGNMAPPRRVVVKKLKGFQTLTIEGQATSVLMNREAKTRSWANKSRADVVREIAAEHGYEGEFLDVEDTARCSTPSARAPRPMRASCGVSPRARSTSTSSTTRAFTGARAIRPARRSTC
jgi:hypothetical protein